MKRGFSIVELLFCSCLVVLTFIIILSVIKYITEQKKISETERQLLNCDILKDEVENHFYQNILSINNSNQNADMYSESLLLLGLQFRTGRSIIASVNFNTLDSDNDSLYEVVDSWGNPIKYNGLNH